MSKISPKKYLDLTSLQSGDVLLTSSRSLTSRLIVLAQRIWHFSFQCPGFSHAIVVIAPLVTFDTVGVKGARFRRQIPNAISEDEQGQIKLWLDVSDYKNIAVMRYGNAINPCTLLMAASVENTSPYPGPMAFLSLFHPKIKSYWNRIKRSGHLESVPQKRFCSSLAAYLLKDFDSTEYLQKADWSAVSPFKLYVSSCEQTSLVVEKTPDSFSDGDVHCSLLQLAQADAGANSFTGFDNFQHASEDLMKAAANSGLIKNSLAHDPLYFIELDGQRVSLIEHPHLSYLPQLKRQIDSNSEMFSDFKKMGNCYARCNSGCRNAVSCERLMGARMAKILAEHNTL
jgi:hypothetical protein